MQDYYARLAQVESGGNPLARNPASSAKGMFQFVDSTAKEYGINAPFGTPEYAKQEIDAVQKFTEDNKAKLAQGLGREPSMGELYLAHQQGADGALKILQNPAQRAVDLVGRDAISLNAGNPDMTAKDFAMQWNEKFGGAESPSAEPQQSPAPETFELELPDGTVLEGVPVGTTKEQIKAKLAAGGYDVSKLKSEKKEIAQEPETRSAGFVQRVGDAFAQRAKNTGEGTQAYMEDKQGLPELLLQGAGQGIGFTGDVLANALVSGYRYLPESDRGLGEGAALLGSIPTGEGKTLKDTALGALQSLTESYRGLKSEYPRAERNLAALGNIGAALLPLKGANVAGKAGTATGKTMSIASEILDTAIPKPQNVTGAMMEKAVNSAYQLSKDLGGTLTPKYTQNLSSRIINKMDEAGATLSDESKEILRGMSDDEGIVRQGVELAKSLDGKPLELSAFEAIDKTLTGLRYKSGISEPAAMKLGVIQRELRDLVDNAKPNDIAGGTEGFEAYRRATALASKKFRMNEIEEMTASAFANQHQPVSNLKAKIGKFLANKDNHKGFNTEELAALEKAAETGVVSDLVRVASGRLLSYAAAASNPMFAPAVSAGSTVVRSLSARSMAQKMQEINNLIATGNPNKQGFINAAAQGATNALGSGGRAIEGAYSGRAGNAANLGLLQELQRELERDQRGSQPLKLTIRPQANQ